MTDRGESDLNLIQTQQIVIVDVESVVEMFI